MGKSTKTLVVQSVWMPAFGFPEGTTMTCFRLPTPLAFYELKTRMLLGLSSSWCRRHRCFEVGLRYSCFRKLARTSLVTVRTGSSLIPFFVRWEEFIVVFLIAVYGFFKWKVDRDRGQIGNSYSTKHVPPEDLPNNW